MSPAIVIVFMVICVSKDTNVHYTTKGFPVHVHVVPFKVVFHSDGVAIVFEFNSSELSSATQNSTFCLCYFSQCTNYFLFHLF